MIEGAGTAGAGHRLERAGGARSVVLMRVCFRGVFSSQGGSLTAQQDAFLANPVRLAGWPPRVPRRIGQLQEVSDSVLACRRLDVKLRAMLHPT